MLLPGFHSQFVEGAGARIWTTIAGSGPPLVLLHGYPQTHVMWHRVAPILARDFTVVLVDLRGYGGSQKPCAGPDHSAYAKRAMAADIKAVMAALGFQRFAAAGHDRGGRVVHRLCLDHPKHIERAAVLDIIPTLSAFERTDRHFALAYYHWFFLAQPADLPERLIGHEPRFFLRSCLSHWSGDRLDFFDEAALRAYEESFADPDCIRATCEDYRAAATIDLEHDRAGSADRIACPLLVLWGVSGLMHKLFDVTAMWREKSGGPVEGHALRAGHFLCEEAPEAVVDQMQRFFSADGV